MPILTSTHTLGTAVSVIASGDNMPQDVWVHNAESSENTEAFIGNADVTPETGMHIHSGETFMFTLGPGDVLFGVSGQGTPVLTVMQIQKED